VFIGFSKDWKWDPRKESLTTRLKPGESATLAIPGIGVDSALQKGKKEQGVRLSPALYQQQRRHCAETWESLLNAGTRIDTPEPLVNHAWKSLLIGSYMVMKGDSMNYSHGNAYERLYQAECGDATRALALFGHTQSAAKTIPALLHYTRDALKYHNAGFKLQMLSHYYWLTHDSNFLMSVRREWTDEINKIAGGLEKDSGLFPREQYCGDIFTPVYSLHSAGAAWRGLRDFATILSKEPALYSAIPVAPSPPVQDREGERRPSMPNSPSDLLRIASELRHAILTATERASSPIPNRPSFPWRSSVKKSRMTHSPPRCGAVIGI